MSDVVFIVVALTFFGVCVAYVRSLDRMVRAEGTEPGEDVTP